MTSNLTFLPTGWELKKLGEIGTFIRGVTYNKNDLLTQSNHESITLLRANNIQASLDLNDLQFLPKNVVKDKLIQDGDILFCMSSGSKDLVGKNILLYGLTNFSFGAFCSIFRNSSINVYIEYVSYVLKSSIFKEKILDLSNGANINNLKNSDLQNLEIPLPPLNEQKQLVSLLDTLFAKIDRSIELLSENITAADALLPSALNTVLGELGEQWETKKLGDIATVGTGVTPLKSKHEYYENGTINWITSKATNNDFVLEAEQKISEVATKECRLKIYSKGTLIVALYGQGKTRGQVSELMIDSTINQAIAAIFVNKENSTSFIKYFLKKSYLELREKASGGTQDNLNLSIIKSIEIPLPPLDIQTQTVEYLDTIRTKVEILKRVQNDKIANLKALKASILDRAFKGEL